MQLEPMQPAAQPPRRVVASYPTYEAAEAAVERLARDGFAVENLAIVGTDLRLVEQVTGRMDAATAAVLGAASGAAAGFVLALLSLLFVRGSAALAVATYWLIGGAVAGAVLGVLAHARTAGRHDFSSVSRMEASRYDLMSTDDVADDALSRLANTHGTSPWPTNARQ
ncbi:MAG: general stress protein [Acidimicrobiales bacterium]